MSTTSILVALFGAGFFIFTLGRRKIFRRYFFKPNQYLLEGYFVDRISKIKREYHEFEIGRPRYRSSWERLDIKTADEETLGFEAACGLISFNLKDLKIEGNKSTSFEFIDKAKVDELINLGFKSEVVITTLEKMKRTDEFFYLKGLCLIERSIPAGQKTTILLSRPLEPEPRASIEVRVNPNVVSGTEADARKRLAEIFRSEIIVATIILLICLVLAAMDLDWSAGGGKLKNM